MKQLAETVTQKAVPDHVTTLVLEIMASDVNDEDVETPYIRYVMA